MATIFMLAIVLGLFLIPMWIVFEKMGRKGWESLIPIYNIYVMLKVVGRPIWLLILFLIPIINIGVWLLICHEIAKRFGKGDMFGIILAFFPIIGFPLVAYKKGEKFQAV